MRSPDPHSNRYQASGFIALALALSLGLSGCGSELATPAGLFIASTTIIINEDKTPTDLVAGAVTGLDCDTIRKSRDKGPLCRAPREEIIEAPVFCYRTLGKIDCFREPDPYGYAQQQVN